VGLNTYFTPSVQLKIAYAQSRLADHEMFLSGPGIYEHFIAAKLVMGM
jgi:hypothetical protein